MTSLPDPRDWTASAESHVLVRLASDPGRRDECDAGVRRLLAGANDSEIRSALLSADSSAAYRALWDVVCACAEAPGEDSGVALAARVFAVPVILVAAANGGAVIPGVLPDSEEIRAMLEQHGVLGAMRNFGLGNALSPLEALEALPPSIVYRWTNELGTADRPRELPAAEVRVERRPEQVHLRFLVGAGAIAPHVPSLAETAAGIGAWGMPLTRALARQLAQPGLDLLPVPRPPDTILRAAHAGRRAQVELAFHLFISNAVREFRASVGDPDVVLSAHRLDSGGAELRVSLSSRLDEGRLDGFRWPLHPLDDLHEIEAAMLDFLGQCRLSAIDVRAEILPDQLPGGFLFTAAAPGRRDSAQH